jgi:hypothetical protein
MDAGTVPHVPINFLLADCVHGIFDHAPKLIFSLNFHAIEKRHPSTSKFEHRDHIYFRDSSTKATSHLVD